MHWNISIFQGIIDEVHYVLENCRKNIEALSNEACRQRREKGHGQVVSVVGCMCGCVLRLKGFR